MPQEALQKNTQSHGSDQPLNLTESALNKIKAFSAKQPADKLFRVKVKTGGCSGLEYDFNFGEKQPDDITCTFDGITILVDPKTALYIHGSTLDYEEDFMKSAFVVTNPNSKGSCSCGISFRVK